MIAKTIPYITEILVPLNQNGEKIFTIISNPTPINGKENLYSKGSQTRKIGSY